MDALGAQTSALSKSDASIFDTNQLQYMQKEQEEIMMIPKDPVMLLSFVNLKLRDYYSSLELLCEELNVDRSEIEEKLESIDYRYDAGKNQFV